ncbi:hypothetical protein bcere0022_12560 [Bacillus cereus Rock3-44]|nr:hypothetical protein bcere0022_12560 [Bacillus cereus Rock3-44]
MECFRRERALVCIAAAGALFRPMKSEAMPRGMIIHGKKL